MQYDRCIANETDRSKIDARYFWFLFCENFVLNGSVNMSLLFHYRKQCAVYLLSL